MTRPPEIIIGCDPGYHNSDLERTRERLSKAKTFIDLSTCWVIPTRDSIDPRVVQQWMFLMQAANAKTGRLFSKGFTVDEAYNSGIQTILETDGFQDYHYLLTTEDDNIVPPDGLLKLYENICTCDEPCKEHFVVVGGLYFTKGEDGVPMLYGDPNKEPLTFEPQIPQKDTIQECNGVPMGFTLYHMGLFRDETLYEIEEVDGVEKKVWFKTEQSASRTDTMFFTQDLYFCNKLRKLGYRMAIDTRVKVGHLDKETGMVW